MTVNSERLLEVQDKLEKLLTDKKCLNSKVTSDAFSSFLTAVEKVRTNKGGDIPSSLRKLEISLKNEGFYKNVKVGFENAKGEISEILDNGETSGLHKPSSKVVTSPLRSVQKQPNPRAVTVTLSNTYARQKLRAQGPGYQRPTVIPDAPPSIRTRKPPIELKGTNSKIPQPEELSTLNKTISRLFNHLEISKQSKVQEQHKQMLHKPKVNRRSPSPRRGRRERDEVEVKEVLAKLQTFEDEFQRRKEKQNEEILSLQAQVQRFRTQALDQSKELEKLRGIHSIANKAKGRHVGLIEERHQEERKDMESRIQELEISLKKQYQGTLQEKENLENTLRIDLMRLKREIYNMGSLVLGSEIDKRIKRPKYRPESERYDVEDLVHTITLVGKEAKSLQDRTKDMQSNSTEDATVWKSNCLEMENLINAFYDDISTHPRISLLPNMETKPRLSQVQSLQLKLNKVKTQFLECIKKVDDGERRISEKETQIESLTETSKSFSLLVNEIESSFKDLKSSEENNGNMSVSFSAPNNANPTHMEMLKHLIDLHSSSIQGKEKNQKDMENDFAALQTRILNLDTGITSSYTDDNIHGDTPTPARQMFIVGQNYDGVSDACNALLKKLDVVQVGFVQIQKQNKDMVNEINTLKKLSDTLSKVKDELQDINKSVGTSLKDIDPSNVVHLARLCKTGVESKVKEVDVKEGIILKTRSELDKLRDEIHILWEYVRDEDYHSGDTSDKSQKDNKVHSSNTRDRSTENLKVNASTKSIQVTKEELDFILRQFNRLKGENATLYKTLQEKDGTVIDAESKLKVERTHLVQQVKDRDEKLTQAIIEIESLKTKIEKGNEDLRIEKKDLEEKLEKEKSHSSQLRSQFKSLEKEYGNVKQSYEDHVGELQSKMKEKDENIQTLSKENETLMTRLSKVTGAKLTDGNPAITNLSDSNRPTKIAENFSELYDNEWTESFEALTTRHHMTEKEAIDLLLRILKDCFNFGRQAGVSQMSELNKVLMMIHDSSRTKEGISASLKQMTKDEIKSVKDIRKTFAVHALKGIKKSYDKDDGRNTLTDTQKDVCLPFISRALELCWFMNVQDPPLALTWTVKTGGHCDTTKFKHYTKSGQFIEYLVWPPLFLFKDGHLLSKGVVQCI